MTRFPPIADADMTADQRAVASEISSGPRGGVRGPFVALLHNPPLARRIQALGEHLRFGTSFSDDLTEIAVLATARHWTCQNEWVPHAKFAQKAGLPDAVIDAIAKGMPPPGLTGDQALVLEFAQQTLRAGQPSDTSYDAAQARFGRAGVLDLLALCGYYSMLAMVLNAARLPLADGVAPPLAPLPSTGDSRFAPQIK